MTYHLLGQDLHDTADPAKKYFATHYGATHFKCEEEVEDGLPLRPTWQAKLETGYTVCVNVQPSPFSETLNEFVSLSASAGLPIKLWVALPEAPSKQGFAGELANARRLGVGVVQFSNETVQHEFHRAVPLSLFGLNRTNLSDVPKARREVIKNAEDTFLDGTPDAACQAICQEVELITRQFAQATYSKGLWRTPKGSKSYKPKFFEQDSWAVMLEAMEARVDVAKVSSKSPSMNKQLIVKTRAFTDWRNSVSHKPKTLRALKIRDAKLRTMFEATRDLLVDWYVVAKPLRLL